MAEHGGFKCAKATLFGFNFLFWLFSLAILGFGIWMRLDHSFLETQGVAKLESDALSISTGGIILIAVAGCCVVLGFFGCCGAAKESRCMLGIYIAFLLVILFVQLIAAACGIFALTVFKQAFKDSILDSMTKNLRSGYGTKDKVTELWDFTQYEVDCCGANGPIDYLDSEWYKQRKDKTDKNNTIPVSCCKNVDNIPIDVTLCQSNAVDVFNNKTPAVGNGLNMESCYTTIEESLIKYSKILIGICMAVSIIELFCFVLGVFLCCNVGKYSYDYE